MPILVALASVFGISVFRLVAYSALVVAVIAGGLTIRQHYINVGWYEHKAAVEKQDNLAIAASRDVQRRTDACSNANGFWDVITQGCKTQDATEESK